ncbi:uncharacterized protein LOC130503146 [Raphanus sativus]|uniref:Auxin-responsive protein n=1 Tax=Raphanus sativus TaxID=3726 RepID=A0A9W3CQI3_RAPSA|nr:uncharacterized protein LOC130503146 [Raphanus sativus]
MDGPNSSYSPFESCRVLSRVLDPRSMSYEGQTRLEIRGEVAVCKQGELRAEQRHSNPAADYTVAVAEEEEEENECNSVGSFYVKMNMEGVPIGRKIDLMSLNGYHELIRTLDFMFNASILFQRGFRLKLTCGLN